MPAERYVYAFDAPPSGTPEERLRLLGGKGANLAVMANDLKLPVPPGFTITTEACREFLAGTWPEALDDELREHVNQLGARLGRGFGDPSNPLLVSVRSGAPVSMPGMMDTILNLGLNSETAAGLARSVGDPDFAADCLRRLGDGYRSVIGAQEVPSDPWRQLRAAVEAVFSSWNSERAKTYRRVEGISDELGTAVTVQAMVFGNRGEDSGTGVLFTRNPSTGEPEIYGDFMFNAQGEDVVAGTHATQPIAALHGRLPDVAAELRRYAHVLERHHRDMCDIEFTVENRRLWMLQVRVGKRTPRAALRIARDMAEDENFPLTREEAVRRVLPHLAEPPRGFVRTGNTPAPVTRGLPASPGVATGAMATSSDAAIAAADSGVTVILVRSETSPEDVRGMARAAGILTARGGLASHAAVVARGWGIPAVVGADAVSVGDGWIDVHGQRLSAGEQISIDGSTGEVFRGELPGRWEVAPEAATLLAWAEELGIDVHAVPDASEPTDDAQPSATGQREIRTDDVLCALLIKGSATPDQLAESLNAPPDALTPLVEQLASAGTIEVKPTEIRLTPAGKLSATDVFVGDRARAGVDDPRAASMLDEFHALDARMKAIVTGWQVRDVDGEQVLNDHTDAGYDARLLDELATLHDDAAAWLEPLSANVRQFDAYRSRLATALAKARDGDQRFVASPRVDSYHSVWFELHEHLIRLAGRTRAVEAAAGRA